ncbi:hypothetical protein L1987_64471 [Smallanthus sonchifolius]|uniref:Uncharacterized protein n=1 Tax=Smallanthus sonchifolius TaxID=185202 RepID=A0ACB9CG63_9ASTR|nr:hypothetical protein L1987_64471 [Smallanthus sonchifolius]
MMIFANMFVWMDGVADKGVCLQDLPLYSSPMIMTGKLKEILKSIGEDDDDDDDDLLWKSTTEGIRSEDTVTIPFSKLTYDNDQ